MRSFALRIVAFAWIAVATACGSLASSPNETSPSADAGDAGSREDATFRDAASDLDASGDAFCPKTAPKNADPCVMAPPPSDPDVQLPSSLMAVCEYGTDPHCTTVARCEAMPEGGTSWYVIPPDPSCVSQPSGCPANFNEGVGMDCPVPSSSSCTYPEGRCDCIECTRPDSGALEPGWSCAKWDEPDGCPEPRPLLGSPCTMEGQECGYGPVCCALVDIGPTMLCAAGHWADVFLACPCVAGGACN